VPPLFDSRTATLNQNDQHNHKENTGNYPDDRRGIHFNSPFPSRGTYESDAEGNASATKPFLLDASAATLNQNDQHDDKENTGNYPDDCGIVHLNSPFFSG
jgi:hypothetical protein